MGLNGIFTIFLDLSLCSCSGFYREGFLPLAFPISLPHNSWQGTQNVLYFKGNSHFPCWKSPWKREHRIHFATRCDSTWQLALATSFSNVIILISRKKISFWETKLTVSWAFFWSIFNLQDRFTHFVVLSLSKWSFRKHGSCNQFRGTLFYYKIPKWW